jgi:hypothetical protein
VGRLAQLRRSSTNGASSVTTVHAGTKLRPRAKRVQTAGLALVGSAGSAHAMTVSAWSPMTLQLAAFLLLLLLLLLCSHHLHRQGQRHQLHVQMSTQTVLPTMNSIALAKPTASLSLLREPRVKANAPPLSAAQRCDNHLHLWHAVRISTPPAAWPRALSVALPGS